MAAAFDFDALLDDWVSRPSTDRDFPTIRAFLDARAKLIVEHLDPSLLPDAIAAYQREGEMLYGRRYLVKARTIYADLRDLFAPLDPLVALWCEAAVAECTVQMGQVEDGVAALADVLTQLEAIEHQPGIDAVSEIISESFPLLELPQDRRPFGLEPVELDMPPPIDPRMFPKA